MNKHLTSSALLAVFVGVLIVLIPSANTAQAFLTPAEDVNGQQLNDGDLISAIGDPDIFIIKFSTDANNPGIRWGFKRLFLNPAIFNMYGHLGGFANVRTVTAEARDVFDTTALYRNCESGSQEIWGIEVTGEDTGVLHHVQMSGAQAAAEDYNFFEKVFCINTNEERFYARSGAPYTRLSQIPRYDRSGASTMPPTSCMKEGESSGPFDIADVECCAGLEPALYSMDSSLLGYRTICRANTVSCADEGRILRGRVQQCCAGLIPVSEPSVQMYVDVCR